MPSEVPGLLLRRGQSASLCTGQHITTKVDERAGALESDALTASEVFRQQSALTSEKWPLPKVHLSKFTPWDQRSVI